MKSFMLFFTTSLLLFQLLLFNSSLLCARGNVRENQELLKKKGTWQGNGIIDLSFAAARNRLRAKMISKGYKEVHEIKIQKKDERSLTLWQKKSQKIIYMIWKIDIDKTGYSWGSCL